MTPLNYTTLLHARFTAMQCRDHCLASKAQYVYTYYSATYVPMSAVILVSKPSERIGISGV